MSDNTKEKNYVGCLIQLLINDGKGEENVLYFVLQQKENKVTLRRTDTQKDMVIPIKYLEENKHFQVL